MLGKANLKKHAKRVGMQSVKAQISILVQSVVLPVNNDVPALAQLSVCFERGGKISATPHFVYNPKNADPTDDSVVLPVNRTVQLLATLFWDPAEECFQEKCGKIILRQLKKNSRFGLDTFKGLGVNHLPLHDIVTSVERAAVQELQEEHNLSLELLPGAHIEATITTKILARGGGGTLRRTGSSGVMTTDSGDGDETMSNISGMSGISENSDISTLAASFSHTRVEQQRSPNKRQQNSFAWSLSDPALGADAGEENDGSTLPTRGRPLSYQPSTYSIVEETEGDGLSGSREQDSNHGAIVLNSEADGITKEMRNGQQQEDNVAFSSNQGGEAFLMSNGGSVNLDGASVTSKDEDKDVAYYQSINASSREAQLPAPAHYAINSPHIDDIVMPQQAMSGDDKRRPVSMGAQSGISSLSGSTISTFWAHRTAVTVAPPAIDGEAALSTPTESHDTSLSKGDFVRSEVDVCGGHDSTPLDEELSASPTGVSVSVRRRGKQQLLQHSEEVVQLYERELKQRAERVERLETQLLAQVQEHKAQVQTLREELMKAETALQRERLARTTLASATTKGDALLAKALSEARDDALAAREDCNRAETELHLLTQDLNYYKNLAETAMKERAEEVSAAQSAASVAAEASVRRAELEAENEELLSELIDIKVEYANLAMDMENEKRVNITLRHRLQKYASQMASLEIKYANNKLITSAATSPAPQRDSQPDEKAAERCFASDTSLHAFYPSSW